MAACLAVAASCGSEPPARSPSQRATDSATAVRALQASQFSDAERAASQALTIDPHNSRAAAVRAIARYQAAGEQLWNQIDKIVHDGDVLKFLDHSAGRTAWHDFGDALDAVDKDLAIAGEDPSFTLELCLACWEHDWNHNGRVDDRDRKLFEIEFDGHGGEIPEGDARRRPTFKFDVGDVDWARAMIAFQHAAVEVVLAYRWNQLDLLFGKGEPTFTIKLDDANRVHHARDLILAGLGYADRSRTEYLAETDDDREWVPNPSQRNHPMPLEVDGKLFETWGAITGDIRRLLESKDGISMRAIALMIGSMRLARMVPDAYIDVGAMFERPTDIVVDTHDKWDSMDGLAHVLHGVLGNGYRDRMTSSALTDRLIRMQSEMRHGGDTFERKLRYLIWLN